MKLKSNKILKGISLFLCFLLCFQQVSLAEMAVSLNIAGHLSSLHSSFISDTFRPLHLRYLSFNPLDNSFKLLLDKGSLKDPSSQEIEDTSETLMQYFLIGLTLPNDTFWVNLRPDSPGQIIDDRLAQTDIGRIMLETDLQLKKDTASFTSPSTPEGREYWDKLYKKAEELYGTDTVTIPTLTRPWIVPGEIIIRETTDSAYIYKATLKVMLEQDYLKTTSNAINSGAADYSFKDQRSKALNEYSTQLIKELIIPKLTKEVNSSKRYASLRQVYYSLIMAQWFKARFKGKQGGYYERINRQDLTNLASKEYWSKNTYFKEYQKSFKDGEYNIRESVYTPTGQVIRSYFSGGIKTTIPKGQMILFPSRNVGSPVFTNNLVSSLYYPENKTSSPGTKDVDEEIKDPTGGRDALFVNAVKPDGKKPLAKLRQLLLKLGGFLSKSNLSDSEIIVLIQDALYPKPDTKNFGVANDNLLKRVNRRNAPIIITSLTQAMESTDDLVRQGAMGLLMRLSWKGYPVEPVLFRKHLKDPNIYVRLNASEALRPLEKEELEKFQLWVAQYADPEKYTVRISSKDGKGAGSGFAFAEDLEYVYLMTNSHVVGIDSLVDVSMGDNFRHTSIGRVIVRYSSTDASGGAQGKDIAFVAVEKSKLSELQVTLVPVKLTQSDNVIGEYSCLVSGYRQRVRSAGIIDSDNVFLLRTVDEDSSEPGDSGSMLIIEENGRPAVAGLHVGPWVGGALSLTKDNRKLLFDLLASAIPLSQLGEKQAFVTENPRLLHKALLLAGYEIPGAVPYGKDAASSSPVININEFVSKCIYSKSARSVKEILGFILPEGYIIKGDSYEEIITYVFNDSSLPLESRIYAFGFMDLENVSNNIEAEAVELARKLLNEKRELPMGDLLPLDVFSNETLKSYCISAWLVLYAGLNSNKHLFIDRETLFYPVIETIMSEARLAAFYSDMNVNFVVGHDFLNSPNVKNGGIFFAYLAHEFGHIIMGLYGEFPVGITACGEFIADLTSYAFLEIMGWPKTIQEVRNNQVYHYDAVSGAGEGKSVRPHQAARATIENMFLYFEDQNDKDTPVKDHLFKQILSFSLSYVLSYMKKNDKGLHLEVLLKVIKERYAEKGYSVGFSDPADLDIVEISPWPPRKSVSASEKSGSPLGGIDFRSLPIVTQAVSDLSANLRDSC